jgi:hypothetical protein
MSFVLNKMASLLATLVVVCTVLFCSSAAQAHANHSPTAPEASVQVPADLDEVQAASDNGGDQDTQFVAATKSDKAGGQRLAGSSCCGTGVSNCMATAIGSTADPLQLPPPGDHGPARQATLLLGTLVDSLIRPPRALV